MEVSGMCAQTEKQVFDFVLLHGLLPRGARVLVGISGGPDSVYLFRFLHQLYTQGDILLEAAHLDHGWRPSSYQDGQWVKSFVESYGVPFHGASLVELGLDAQHQKPTEENGRYARRLFFERVAGERSMTHIALGHHADDQVETFFVRLARGATVSGLVGMRPRTGMYIRPLLSTRKAQIIACLAAHGHEYLTDETNQGDLYLRNRIRNTLVPTLTAVDQRFVSNTNRLMEHLADTEDFLCDMTTAAVNSITIAGEQKAIRMVRRDGFCKLHPFMQRRIVLWILIEACVPFVPTTAFVNEVLRFIHNSGSGVHQVGVDWSIVKTKSAFGIHMLPRVNAS